MSKFCIICGDKIEVRYSFGTGHHVCICKNEECRNKYLVYHQLKHKPASTEERKKNLVAGFCARCGKPKWLDFYNNVYRHNKDSCDTASDILRKRPVLEHRAKKIHHRELAPKRRVPLKPWKDPNSLFCSPNLAEIVGKEVATGEECRENV